jgi:5-methylcytosine-specific restriction endonuclease McrA
VTANPAIIKKHEKARHKRSRIKRLQGMKKYYKTNKLSILKQKSIYGQKHRKRLNGKSSLKRKRLKQATPLWLSESNRKRIIEIYEECPDGYHVDHIVPIKGLNVCGLHVPWNLQYLLEVLNLEKYNKY